MSHLLRSTYCLTRSHAPSECVSIRRTLALRAACLVILLIGLTLAADAQVAVPIRGVDDTIINSIQEDGNIIINGIQEIDGHLYVSTSNGAFRLVSEKDAFEPVRGVSGQVKNIVSAAGKIWFASSEGLY